MRTLSAPTLAALSQASMPMAQLLLVRLPSGDIALNTTNWTLTWGGIDYVGAAGLGSIASVRDTAGEVQGLQLSLDGGPAAQIGLALDGGDVFQGCIIELRTAIFDATTYQVIDAPLEWTGYGDTFIIQEDGDSANIQCTAESDAVDMLRGHPLTGSDGDHQSVYPGDRAFEYRQSQVGVPVVWPAKEFFFQ